MKEIDNQNATKANGTRDNAYKIRTNKYIENEPSEPMTISMREKRDRQSPQEGENANFQLQEHVVL